MYFELKNKSFYRKSAKLMLPVILQQLITVGINFLDNLMVGGFGETQIAAAAFGNQFYGLFQFICMGLGSGAVVMSSQFWGRGEHGAIRTTAAIALRVTVALCAAFTALALALPHVIMRVFTSERAVIAVGTPYMRIIGLTFLMAGLSSTATYMLRSAGKVNIPLAASAIAFFLNLFFNWVFIFGKFGAPRLEIVGAAVGTVIARAFEFCFVFGYFVFRDDGFGFRLKHFLLPGGSLNRQYVRYSVPVIVSDLLLGLSLTLTFVIVGHIGEEFSAAVSIINSLVQLTTVFIMGMAGASAIVIGNTIGGGDIPRAKREGNTYMLISVLFGLAMVPLLRLLEGPYFGMYEVTAETLRVAHGLMLVNCIYIPVQFNALITSKGILRGGGDTRFLLLADSSMVWLVSLPLGALAGLVWGADPIWVYALLRLEFPLKGIICAVRYFSGKWIKVITSGEKNE